MQTSSSLIAHAQHHPGTEAVTLQFTLKGIDRQLVRRVDEELSRVLVRIERLVNPIEKKRGFKSSTKTPKPSTMALMKAAAVIQFKTGNHAVLPPTLPVLDALYAAAYFCINEVTYHIIHNEPRVNAIATVDKHFNGISIRPSIDLIFCTPDECTWTWHRGDVLVGSSFVYTPTSDDVGHALTIACTPPPSPDASPTRVPIEPVVVHTSVVQACPDRSVFGPRQILGRVPPSNDGLRLMTYNILYSKYARADREFNRMYPFAAPGVLQEAYRMPLVALELLESRPDVVCLQEMGETICRSYFEPLLAHHGYKGVYAGKAGSTPEGCAIFARNDTFEAVETEVVAFSAAIDSLPRDSAITAFLHCHPQVDAAIRQVPSVGQIVTLLDKRHGHVVLVANTHMFYRADANIVRLVQAALFTAAIEATVARLSDNGATKVRVVVAGDLNARPMTSSIQFLLNGHVGCDHDDWQQARAFRWTDRDIDDSGRPSEGTMDVPTQFSHILKLRRAVETEFTTYLRNHEFTFQDTLDYILVDPTSFRVVQQFPLFTLEQVDSEKSLPSTVFPSDHVSIVCDVEYT
ncbi:hypothetical protein H310_09090 [Aphanomyces invadans]|uniref:Endonuclease/exonuclease/phosphatase domain-containing protein n=1 Tax=Aphanomyces invadans TaxID=157072 RepID=A0A024TVR2_9STRA|nr:hypothetical protein H310_09090 [Aphanomyces invadans]ETV97716.1 hypothetical protein H310_09090 [Aphanomyces invadans]|eukprot:XP_008873277.1 hypothetical protein H310_09090 [Aphanomyces invadans]